MNKRVGLFVTTLQIAIGCVFIFSGVAKLLEPHQASMFVSQLVGIKLESGAIRAFSTLEAAIGTWVVITRFSTRALLAVSVILAGFVGILMTAKLRGIAESCGCFGSAFKTGLPAAIVRTGILLFVSGIALAMSLRGSAETNGNQVIE